MSVSADLACMDCKVIISLGKAVRGGNTFEHIHAFDNLLYPGHIPPALHEWRLRYTYALHKMLAEHVRHNLRVIVEGDTEENIFADDVDYITIGGDRMGDISLDAYLAEWLEGTSP